MVTRYTIDQILACNDTHRRNPPMSPKSDPETQNATIIDRKLGSPVMKNSNVIVRGDVEIREVLECPLGENQIKHHNLDNRLIGNKNISDLRPGMAFDSDLSNNIGNNRNKELNINSTPNLNGNDSDEPKTPNSDTMNRNVLRPVPVRPNAIKNSPNDNEAHLPHIIRQEPPDLRNGHVGYNFNGLNIGSSVYSLMLRQYMEAQAHLRDFATSGIGLPYHGLESGLSPFGGVGLPYSLTNRSRRRGGQVRFTGEQTRQLEVWFKLHKYITPSQRKTIARELNLQERQVKTWFQNRRAKWRKAEGQNDETALIDADQSPSTSQEANVDDQLRENENDPEYRDEEEDIDGEDLVVDDPSRDFPHPVLARCLSKTNDYDAKAFRAYNKY